MAATLLKIATWIVVSASLSTATLRQDEINGKSTEAAQQVDDDDPLTAEMRKQMLTFEPQTNPMIVSALAPVFHFGSFAEEHGLAKSRKAVLPLLTDSEEEVREQAARAALEWLTAKELGDGLIATMLKDNSWSVKKVALHFVPDSNIDPEVLFAYVRRPRSSLHIAAMNELPRLIIAGNEKAQSLLLGKIGSWNSQSAANAIILTGTLGANGRFAEAKLREALSDHRNHYESLSLCMTVPVQNSATAVEALRRIGFRADATAEALRDLCRKESAKYLKLGDDEYMDNQTWVNAAIALATCRQEYEPVREAIFILNDQTEVASAPVANTISTLLEFAPAAITEWEHGLMMCRRLLGDPFLRSHPENWVALRRYPNAAKVFEPEIQQYANDEVDRAFVADDCAIAEVVAILAMDGFSNEELDFSLRFIGLQQRSPDDYDSEGVADKFAEQVRDHHKEHIAEMMMLDLLNSTSVNPEHFRRILKRLAPQDGKSKLRQRLEKLLKDLETPAAVE